MDHIVHISLVGRRRAIQAGWPLTSRCLFWTIAKWLRALELRLDDELVARNLLSVGPEPVAWAGEGEFRRGADVAVDGAWREDEVPDHRNRS